MAPVFKSGEHDDRSNYRPISVLPVVSRLFEKLVYDQLYNHLDKNKYLYLHQTSFRALHSAVTCLLKSTNDWYVNIDNSKVNAAIFIDLKKAFDTVDHDILLAKMHHYGINGIEHDWFRSYLNNRKQFCNVSGVSSEIQAIEIGVPQGSCLGPLLFLLYVNDLPFALKKVHAAMYVDDTTICYSSDNIEDLNAVVNAELTCLNEWLCCNKLSLNIVKTQVTVIGSKRKISHINNLSSVNPAFNVANNNIGLVNETKYLGVMIDANLKWDSQIKNIQGKVSQALGLLKYAKRYVPLGTLNSMYKGIVEPHFNYRCSVWGSCGTTRLNKLQKLQSRAAIIVTDSEFDTLAAPLIQNLGWPTIRQLIHRETSTMTYKCLNLLAPAYLSGCFSKLSDSHTRFLRNSGTDVHIPRMRTSNGQKSFAYRGAKVWNYLDAETKLASSVQCFKSRLKNYMGL